MHKLASLALFASALFAACGGDNPEPTRTPDATQPPLVTATPAPTTEPIATPTPSERAPDPAAVRILTFAPGEPITGVESGAFVMNPATGAVHGFEVKNLREIANAYVFSPDGQFIYADHRYLITTRGGPTVMAVPPEYRPIVSPWYGAELLSQNARIAVVDEGRNILTVDSEFEHPRELGLPPLLEDARAQVPFVASRDGVRAAVQIDGLHIVDFATGHVNPVEGDPGNLGGPLDNAFWTSSGDDSIATVSRYDWTGSRTATITVDLPYEAPFVPRIDVSPDGTFVAVWAAVSPQDWGDMGANPTPGAVTFYSFRTGDPVFRVRGSVIPSYWGAERTLWLANSGAIVLGTLDGQFLVNADGTWGRGGLPGSPLMPSPWNNEIFAVAPYGVWNSSTGEQFVPEFSISLEPALPPWGLRFDEIRYSGPPVGRGGGSITPAARPAIEFPPFGPDELEVVGSETCLELRIQPTVAAEVVACLQDGTSVTIAPIAAEHIDHLEYAPPTTRPGPLLSAVGNWREACPGEAAGCSWISIETPSGQTGWAITDYLRWPGTPPPEAD